MLDDESEVDMKKYFTSHHNFTWGIKKFTFTSLR